MFGPDIDTLAQPDGPHAEAYRAYLERTERFGGGDYVPLWFLRKRILRRLAEAERALEALDPMHREPTTLPVVEALGVLHGFLEREYDPHDHRLAVLALLLGSEEMETDRDRRRDREGRSAP